jgi:hypothetical protein
MMLLASASTQLALLFDGTEQDPPPPRFAVGDRVVTAWGRATVIAIHEMPWFGSARVYTVKHDWSDAPAGFGHHFGENECEPAGPEPVYESETA